MAHSVNDKFEYNKNKHTYFSNGYCLGVYHYRQYPKEDADGKSAISCNMSFNKKIAATGDKSKPQTQFCKGYMCALHDCAKERKQKYNK